jgi:hypothetical protein
MNPTSCVMKLCSLSMAAMLAAMVPAGAEPVSPAFTYQGRLNQSGSPANGQFDLKFELYSSATGGTPLGSPVTLLSQTITGGLFSADLNFGGPAVFDGTAYWLAISAKPAGAAVFTPVPGRTAIRPAPYAVHSLSAGTVKDGAVTTGSLANGAVTAAKLAGSAVGLPQLNAAGTPASGQVLASTGTGLSWVTPPGGDGTGPWQLNNTFAYYNNRVGIGTDDRFSQSMLTVRTTGPTAGMEHTNGNVRMATYAGPYTIDGGLLGTISNHPLGFFVNNNAPSMTLVANGNVGIGTTAPVAKLDVYGDQMTWGVSKYGHGTRQMLNLWGEEFGIGVQSATLYHRSATAYAWYAGGVHHNDTYNSGGGTTLMTLDGTRGLDLGSRLGKQIGFWGGDTPRQFCMGIQAATLYQRVGNQGGDAFAWYKGGVHNDGQRNSGGGVTLMQLDEESGLTLSGRNMAFTRPSSGVAWVNGSGTMLGNIHRFGSVDSNLYFSNAGTLNLTGLYLAPSATSFTSTSDERLKSDIEPITGILDKIKNIRVAGFNMAGLQADPETGRKKILEKRAPRTTKDGKVIKQEIGSIAQDWIKDFPELVTEPVSEDDHYGLAYDRIGVVALGAVKELHQQIRQRDEQIATLEARLARLEAILSKSAPAPAGAN